MKSPKTLLAFVFAISILGAAGCSTQYRYAPTDSGTFIKEQLTAASTSNSSSEVSQFMALANTKGAVLYYSDSEAYGPVLSTTSVSSFAFMDRPDLSYAGIAYIQLFYVDLLTTSGIETGLMISFREIGSEATQVKVLMGTRSASINEGEYTAVLGSGGKEKLVLKTKYLNDVEDLEPVIRMDVYDFDAEGYESYIGQFSTMVGYDI